MSSPFAACDQHLPKYMRDLMADDRSATVQVRHLATPHENYWCGCGEPAHWFVRAWTYPE